VTEELPWEFRGAPADPLAPPENAEPGERRSRTAVDGLLRPPTPEPEAREVPQLARSRADLPAPEWSAPGWSPGQWWQSPREAGGGTASRRQLREMRAAPVEPAPVEPAPVEPAPVEPAPVDPELVDPELVDPELIDPELVDPELVETELVEPDLQEPAAFAATTPQPPKPPPASDLPDPFPPIRAPEPGIGPGTGELEVYGLSRRGVQHRSSRRDRPVRHDELVAGFAGKGSGHRDALRAGVERWSRWAAGLGLPPRDATGARRYPGRELHVPPAVWVTAAVGVAVVVGLVTGILVSGSSQATTVAPAVVTTATVTVTNATTAPAVTRTTTRTRTRTLTLSPTPPPPSQAPAQPPGQGVVPGGGTLAPGSSGPEVVTLQQELAQLGLFQGAPTGTYDLQTQAAVQNFQARAGITADPPGVAGPTTLAAIKQAVGG
jgi:Putative peptidoglycan binding domain